MNTAIVKTVILVVSLLTLQYLINTLSLGELTFSQVEVCQKFSLILLNAVGLVINAIFSVAYYDTRKKI